MAVTQAVAIGVDRNGKQFCHDFNTSICKLGGKCTYQHQCSHCLQNTHGAHRCTNPVVDATTGGHKKYTKKVKGKGKCDGCEGQGQGLC